MITETEQGSLARQIADATDRAEAFRAWIPPGRFHVVFEPTFAGDQLPAQTGFCTNVLNEVFNDNFDGIVEIAQSNLDAKVESLYAELSSARLAIRGPVSSEPSLVERLNGLGAASEPVKAPARKTTVKRKR